MPGVGSAFLVVAFGAAIYTAIASVYGARAGKREWVVSGRRGMYCVAGLVIASMVLLEAAYLRSDFEFALVAQNSSTDTPTFYKLTAVWSSQAGSLLLWVTLLALFSSIALYATRRRHREIAPYAAAVLGAVAAFFLFLMLFYASPFDTLSPVPVEGNGLNPLLRHPAMMIHPPMLYSGYVGFSIPFAFAIGALITRRTDASWIRSTRRFALIAWTFLGFGILLGALWSYSELGWGGYWAWDAVENASLLPWLTGTAFLHSIQIQEKRGMLKVWNVSLIVATFLLALLGTFLVRSGILDSIHAFGESTLGKPFLVFIAIAAIGSIGLVVARLPYLKSEAKLDSFLSREAFFLANNLVLVGLAFVVFWGTFFPLISEAVTGREQSVGPPWFDRYTVPLALVLVLLTGIGPALTWRRSSPGSLKRTFAVPLAAVVLGALLLVLLTPAEDSPLSLLMFVLAVFTLTVAGQELWRGAGARPAMPLRPRRRPAQAARAGEPGLYVGVVLFAQRHRVLRDQRPRRGPPRDRARPDDGAAARSAPRRRRGDGGRPPDRGIADAGRPDHGTGVRARARPDADGAARARLGAVSAAGVRRSADRIARRSFDRLNCRIAKVEDQRRSCK